jgi:phosphoribosylanthranilate isomerase
MWIKICGITREEDALLAASSGADAIGLVFWPHSKRFVPVDAAARIVRNLPPRTAAVGVFVNETPNHVNSIAGYVGLQFVQLHGDESADVCLRVTLPVIKAFNVGPGFQASVLEQYPGTLVLLDGDVQATEGAVSAIGSGGGPDPTPRLRGGTGRTADWEAARRVAAGRRIVLSGGLTAENVGRAIVHVRPYGVDVSSGVESAPGIKDGRRLREFVAAVRGAERFLS